MSAIRVMALLLAFLLVGELEFRREVGACNTHETP